MFTDVYKNTGKGNELVKRVDYCGFRGAGIVSFFGCNLKCPFCFAQKYSYSNPDTSIDNKGRISVNSSFFANEVVDFVRYNSPFCYLQLTGGEPVISLSNLEEIVETLLHTDALKTRTIFQTNGITIGRNPEESLKLLSKLRSLVNSFVLFELSLKGTNSQEFSVLSGTDWRDGYKTQVNAYWTLREVCDSHENLNVVARLGTGNHRKSISFVYPQNKQPMFLREDWSKEFSGVYEDSAKRTGQLRMISEIINAEGDGSVNNYLRRSIPALARCAKAQCILSRISNSKAVAKVEKQFDEVIPSTMELDKPYEQFLSLFEPMKEPSHAYCGRNEFPKMAKRNCPSVCQWR